MTEPEATGRTGGCVIGVMTMEVESQARDDASAAGFRDLVARAAHRLEASLTVEPRLGVHPFAFSGPHLTPAGGAYNPLDFLEVALAEKIERRIDLLLVVTEVDLATSQLSYALALPSRLTKIGVLSTKRLDPSFWGEAGDATRTEDRLWALMLYVLGNLLGLPASPEPGNPMHRIAAPQALEQVEGLCEDQLAAIRDALPKEARQRSARRGRAAFAARVVLTEARAIGGAVLRADPLRLLSRMPTMLAAALSVIIVQLFSAEV